MKKLMVMFSLFTFMVSVAMATPISPADSIAKVKADSIAQVKLAEAQAKIEKAQAKNDSIAKVKNRVYRVPYGRDAQGKASDTLVIYPGDALDKDIPFTVYDSLKVVGEIKRNGTKETQFKVAKGVTFFLRDFSSETQVVGEKKTVVLRKGTIAGDSSIPDVDMSGGYLLAILSSLVVLCTGIWFFFFRK